MSGTITDPAGAAVPEASVVLENTGTHAKQVATTDASGRYLFPAVDPAVYTVTVTAKGFRTLVVNNLQVVVGKSSTVDGKLELGQVSETVEVAASGMTELQTTDASVGEVMSGTELNRMPINGRSAAQLIFDQPAVAPDVTNAPQGVMGGGGDIGGGQIAGARSEQVTFLIDGGDATSDLEGSNNYAAPDRESSAVSPVVPVPLDSVQEFRVSTTNPNATYAGSSGGQISFLTKSGTNTFHGEAYEYYDGDALDANGWTNNFNGINKPHTVDNRFGGQFGGPVIKDKLFFSGFFEGRRFHDAATVSRVVPTQTLKDGILRFQDAAGNIDSYNFNPANGPLSSSCGGGACDPRGIGMSPVIASQLALYPTGNNASLGDGLNTTGFVASIPTPIITNVSKLKLDYNINSKWSAFATWQYSGTQRSATRQVDILGTAASTSGTPYYANFFTAQLVGQVTPNFTTVTHASFLRNWWAWTDAAPTPLVSGTTAALQIGGEGQGASTSTGKLLADPINIDTQNARSRTWDGHDWYMAEDGTWFKGAHTLQFGGNGRIWHDYHLRTDDVLGGLTTAPIYYIGSESQSNLTNVKITSQFAPSTCGGGVTTNCISQGDVPSWNGLYASLLGLVDHSSQIQTRNGSFQANPLGTPLFDNVTIPSFDTYFQDVWKVRPNLTITLGLDYGVQLTPNEASGKQVVLTYADGGAPVNFQQYLQNRATALGQGVAFNPSWGLTPVNSLATPLQGKMRITDWTDLGPRISLAWQPGYKNKLFGDHQTVFRVGYAKVFDRTSAVNEALSPLLTGGLADASQCSGPIAPTLGGGCSGATTDPTNAYRIGVDGTGPGVPAPTNQTIPYVPGSPFGLHLSAPLDPFVTPGYAHEVTVSVQRALPHNYFVELGYIGRFSRNLPEGQQLTASDYLMKDPASGQTLAQAFDAIRQELASGVQPTLTVSGKPVPNPAFKSQPFFDNTIGLTNCQGLAPAKGQPHYTNCGQLVAFDDPGDIIDANLGSFSAFELNFDTPQFLDNMQVFEFAGVTDGGFSDYNAGYATIRKSFAQGLQFQGNWTWSHAIGIQGINQQYLYSNNSPYYPSIDRGSELFDHRHTFTGTYYYELPFGKGKRFATSNGVLDHIVGGWETSGIFTFFTGAPNCPTGDGNYGAFFASNCLLPGAGGFPNYSTHSGVAGSGGVGVTGDPAAAGSGLNAFANPAAVYNSLTEPNLSTVGRVPYGEITGFPYWNFDFSLGKNIAFTERYSLLFTVDAFNVFNHVIFNNPQMDMNTPSTFGVINSQANAPRALQLGLKFIF